jgi:hypothetical protein
MFFCLLQVPSATPKGHAQSQFPIPSVFIKISLKAIMCCLVEDEIGLLQSYIACHPCPNESPP